MIDILKRLEREAASREEGYGLLYDAIDEIVRLRELIAEWKEEPVGGISKFGVVYLSPERVAAIVDPLKESLSIADAACRTYWGWEYGHDLDDDIPNSSLLVKWRHDYVKRK